MCYYSKISSRLWKQRDKQNGSRKSKLLLVLSIFKTEKNFTLNLFWKNSLIQTRTKKSRAKTHRNPDSTGNIKVNYTYGDPVDQRCTVDIFVRLFNVAQVDFGSAHDDPDQLAVVGAHSRHGSFQPLGVVVALLLGALHCACTQQITAVIRRGGKTWNHWCTLSYGGGRTANFSG